MGPPSYMRSLVDRNVIMLRMTVLYGKLKTERVSDIQNVLFMQVVQNLLDTAFRLLKHQVSNHFCSTLYMVLCIGVCDLLLHPVW
jgi:hypothetical protein